MGLWTRVHAYHQDHSTVLTKLGLLADEAVVDFVVGKFRELLKGIGERSERPIHIDEAPVPEGNPRE
jgi:hypothetical protein